MAQVNKGAAICIPADTAQRQLRVQKRRAMALAPHKDADGASVRKRKKPFVL